MKKKYLITKLIIILILSLVISCQNKNSELEKKIEKLELSAYCMTLSVWYYRNLYNIVKKLPQKKN